MGPSAHFPPSSSSSSSLHLSRRFNSLCRCCRWALVAVLVVWPPHLLVIFHLLRLVYLLLVMSPFIGMSFSPSSRASPPLHLPSSSSCSSSHAIVAATAAAVVTAVDVVDAAVITAAAPFLLLPPSSLLFRILVAVVKPVCRRRTLFPLSKLVVGVSQRRHSVRVSFSPGGGIRDVSRGGMEGWITKTNHDKRCGSSFVMHLTGLPFPGSPLVFLFPPFLRRAMMHHPHPSGEGRGRCGCGLSCAS